MKTETNKEQPKISFASLSTGLKALIVMLWIIIIMLALPFIAGLMIGLSTW